MTPATDPAPRALRLALAMTSGLDLPAGPIGLLHPAEGELPPDLPHDRLLAISPLVQVHAAMAAQGIAVTADDPAPGSLAAALICLPRGRAEAADLIARATRMTAGPVIVDGQKADGIEAMLKALRGRVALSEAISKGHGKIAWFPGAAPAGTLDDWLAGPARITGPDGDIWQTRPGVFSADGVDPASALLAAALPSDVRGVAVDLGAGWGYLSARLLARAPGLTALHLVEADARALASARVNVTDPRAQFHWADATRLAQGPQPSPLAGIRANLVVMNPPFHQGRAGRPDLGAGFIAAAARLLGPAGTLWMVANRHLPYEAALAAAFREVEDIAGSPGFKLIRATRPQAAATPAPQRRRLRR